MYFGGGMHNSLTSHLNRYLIKSVKRIILVEWNVNSMRQISLLKPRCARCGYRMEDERFYAGCFLFQRRMRCSLVLFHLDAYNGTLQDQSSSHLSAVLEIAGSLFHGPFSLCSRISFSLVFVRSVHVHTCESTPSRRFLLTTLSFSPRRWCESLVYLAMIIRSDRGRFPQVVQTQP